MWVCDKLTITLDREKARVEIKERNENAKWQKWGWREMEWRGTKKARDVGVNWLHNSIIL